MVLDKLGQSLKETLKKVTSSIFVDEKLVNELVKDIQRSLLQSDVNVRLVFDLTKSIKERALKEEPKGLSKKEFLVNIVYEELVKFLGEKAHSIQITKKPFKVMLVGLFGNGKTTSAGKLGKFFQKRGQKIALMSTDTWRPAAFKQLEMLGKELGIPVFGNPSLKDPVAIFESFKDQLDKYDVIIIDTAGRDALSDELILELEQLNAAVQPDETLLVMNADIGQAAESQAKKFNESCKIDGVLITKLDGTAKGGGALVACAVTGANVAFIGVGEKLNDLEEFDPKRFVGRLLGMGDLEALLEKAREAMSEDQAKDMSKKLLKGEFNLLDLYEQMSAMKKMGPLNKILDMVPGFGQMNLPKDMLLVQEGKLEKWKFVMDSCTRTELEEPDTISGTRIERIAFGSGTSVSDVRDLVKQYKQSKKVLKMMKGGGSPEKGMAKMMKKLGKGMPGMKF